jgi:AcrR family transcriptional regulator
MGTAERKVKEKEELKALILQAAKKLFVEKGVEQTTIRNIAAEIEYSVGTVYVYYKDKNDILHDLHSQGFTQLGDTLRVLNFVAEPMERLKALSKAYMNFAVENPDMYDLMFSMKAPMVFLEAKCQEKWNEGKAAFEILHTVLSQCLEAGYFKGHQLEPLAFCIWSALHGMCSLHNSHRVRVLCQRDPQDVITSACNELILMIDKK